MRSWVLVEGLSRLLLVAVAFVAIDLLLDWSFQMDRAQRAVTLGLGLSGLVAVAYRRLLRPLAVRPSDDALCLEIEEQHPELREGLISALQFARALERTPDAVRTPDDGGAGEPWAAEPDGPGALARETGVSPSMVHATIELGARAAGRIEPVSVLNRRRFLANAALLAAGVFVLGGTAAAGLTSETIAIWFQRNVLLGDRDWPQDVHFEIAGAAEGVLTVPRGEDWPLDVTVTDESRRAPHELWLEVRGRRQRQRLDAVDPGRRFRTRLAGVSEPLEFRIVESRAASPWIAVRLVERPAVTALKLTVTPPGYTGASAESLPPGGGPYRVLEGSRLSIRGEASKPLASATLTVGRTSRSARLHDDATTRGSPGSTHRSLPAPGPPTGFSLDLAADQLLDGDYAIELVDTERLWLPGRDGPQSLAAREPATFRLRLVPDRAPQVQAKLRGIGNLVTPRAFLPIECRITDDYAVAAVRLQHRWRGERDETETVVTQPLNPPVRLPAESVTFEHVLDLEPVQLPAGLALSFVVEAEDTNSVSGPGIGRSAVFLVRVVTEGEFRAALLAREREQRGELERRVRQQDELHTETRALLAAVRGTSDLDARRREELARVQKRQKTLGDDLARIARRFEDVVVEVRHNRIEEEQGPLQTRLTGQIIAPLWSVGSEEVAAVVQLLERARLRAAVPGERDPLLAQAAAVQERILERIREVLSHMEQSEGFQEAVNMLLEVEKAQGDVLQRTEQEKQDAIRRLLEGAGATK